MHNHKFTEEAKYSAFCALTGTAISFGAIMPQAEAHTCVINPPSIDFGTIEGAVLHDISVPVTMTMRCVALDKNSPVKYCLMIAPLYAADDARLYSGKYRILRQNGNAAAGTQVIPFNFYLDSNEPWGAPLGRVGDYGEPIVGDTEMDTDTKIYSIPFNVTIGGGFGLQIATGNYWNYFQITLNYNYSNQTVTDPSQLCAMTLPGNTINELTTMRVSAEVESSCDVSVPADINFSKNFSLSAVLPAEGKIHVVCNKGTNYQIGLDKGDHANGGAERAMQCSTEASCGQSNIYYDLYQDAAHSQIWGNDWNSADIVKGASSGPMGEDYPVYAKLYAGQTKAATGTYSDTVVVTLRVDNAAAN